MTEMDGFLDHTVLDDAIRPGGAERADLLVSRSGVEGLP